MTRKIKHYLVTVELKIPYRMHAYLMTKAKEKEQVKNLVNELLRIAEMNNMNPLGIVMYTELSDDIDTVREIMRRNSPEINKCMEEAADQHRSSILFAKNMTDDVTLMGLH